MKSDQDDSPILINTQLKPVDCQWNHDGTLLAIAGRSSDSNPGPNQNNINFYTPLGKLIRTMKLPGNQIAGLSWEGHSLRLAFAIDSFIYLAQVKHDYMWTCFSNTLVYHFHRRNKTESYVMFWDTKNNEVNLNLSTIFIFRLFIHVAFMFMLFLV
jgi:WD repeat-containing protein 35